MFYDKLEQICKQNGISPSRMAVELKLSKSAVTRWKRGEGITNTTLKKISDYFGVPIGYFLDDNSNSTEEYTKKETAEIIDSPEETERRQLIKTAAELASSMPTEKLRRLIKILKDE